MGGLRNRKVLVATCAQTQYATWLVGRAPVVGVVLVIDTATHTITDAELTPRTDFGRRLCGEMVIGYRLAYGLGPLLQELGQALLIRSQPAFTTALRAAVRRYWERPGQRPGKALPAAVRMDFRCGEMGSAASGSESA